MFDSSCEPVELNKKKLSFLLYADDIILMSDSACGLHSCIDKLELFCNKWNLSVNLDKTNVIIFNKSGRVLKNMSFHLGTTEIKLCTEYKHLGILFKSSVVFSHAVSLLCNKATKAMFCISKQLISDRLNVVTISKAIRNLY